MRARRARLDDYGRPLPTLVDAQVERLLDRPVNQHQRHFLIAQLDDYLAQLLHRGIYATLHLECGVVDGQLSPDVYVTVQHRHQPPAEER